MDYSTRTTCRICGAAGLTDLFSLGEQFVSDFVPADKVRSGKRCPIALQLCPGCGLVQARHAPPAELLYRRFYWFRSGVTATLRAALAEAAEAGQRLADLRPGDVVLDIGSNDSTMLRAYTAPGIIRVGCEPAANLAEEARQGIDCLIREFWAHAHYRTAVYFDRRAGRWEPLPKAKLITAFGMIYDADDPNQFVGDAARALAPGGVFVAQLMCLKQMLDKGDVGNLANEHLLFPSLVTLRELFGRHGLAVFDVEENDVNGGSYRVYAGHAQQYRNGSPRLAAALAVEAAMGLDRPDTYAAWLARVRADRDRCAAYLRGQKAAGKRVHVLGASTKGNVLLQWLNLDAGVIEAASERSPEKVGLFTAGTGIPIVSEEASRAMRPDVYLVLPYAFLGEIVERERDFLDGGGRMLVPLPRPRLLFRSAGKTVEVTL